MKNLTSSLNFIIKRVFRPASANVMWLIIIAMCVVTFTVSVSLFPVAQGDTDYRYYLIMPPFLSVFLSMFGLSYLYNDIFSSVYIRTSRIYKSLRTRAVPIFALLFDIVIMLPSVTATAIVNPSALPDFILVSGTVIAIGVLFSMSFILLWAVYFGIIFFNIVFEFSGNTLAENELGLLPPELTGSLPTALLLAAAFMLFGLILSFIISDILFRVRKRPKEKQMLKGATQA